MQGRHSIGLYFSPTKKNALIPKNSYLITSNYSNTDEFLSRSIQKGASLKPPKKDLQDTNASVVDSAVNSAVNEEDQEMSDFIEYIRSR